MYGLCLIPSLEQLGCRRWFGKLSIIVILRGERRFCWMKGSLFLKVTHLGKVIEHLDIKNFRNNSSVNLEFLKEGDARMFEHGNFIRTGVTGGGKQELDQFPAVKNKFDDWENKNLKNTGIIFPQMK